MRTLCVVAALLAAAPFTAGCYVHAEPATVVVEDEPDYEPLFYEDEYVVYYEDDGRPYCYVEERVFYIPTTYVHYEVYVSNYHRHKTTIHKWAPPAHKKKIYRREQWEHEKAQRPKRHPASPKKH